jgi:hypothetical protein
VVRGGLVRLDLLEILRVGGYGGVRRYGSQDDRICTVTVARV